ncbi:hypothetical protein HRI96_05190 [Treponema parvum]|uniref:Uncharacterized protein n=1 Tax=Treponema parvum TaxID=138851 RepID=A0A975ICC9_9SPIR|nr:hypothetical protein [Treponema parvum]QTQ11652.1 hypothetical protein HRI96_05190 [Treponema parvum]QTQ16405.1 hypothetical protein HXT04_06735 [Treponema parvum]
MKKNIIFAFFVLLFAAFYASAVEWQESSLSYINTPVYRILDASDVYVVSYAKDGLSVGTVTIPKRWIKRDGKNPAKLSFRSLPTGMKSYMTVITKDKAFYKVMLTVPTDHRQLPWGQVTDSTKFPDDGKDTLEM